MIRLAETKDIDGIYQLLIEVLNIHHRIRPDLFKEGVTKYTKDELKDIIEQKKMLIFVYVDKQVLGHCFCSIQNISETHNQYGYKTMYIDDLCVLDKARGQNIGTKLYDYAVEYAKKEGCYNITLNVWNGNDAINFYQKNGLNAQKITLERILKEEVK